MTKDADAFAAGSEKKRMQGLRHTELLKHHGFELQAGEVKNALKF